MSENLTKKSEQELQQLHEESGRLLNEMRENRKRTALASLNTVCTENGISVTDLKLFVKSYGKQQPNPEDIKTYGNPLNAEQRWVDDGTSRKPKWIRDHIKSGKSLTEIEEKPAAEAA